MPYLFHSLVVEDHVDAVVVMIVMEIKHFGAVWLLHNVIQASLLGLELELHLIGADYNQTDSQ